MEIYLLNLKVLVLTLLVAASQSHVPLEIRLQAEAVASTTLAYIEAQSVATTSPVTTSPVTTGTTAPIVQTTPSTPSVTQSVTTPVTPSFGSLPQSGPSIVGGVETVLIGGPVEVNVIESLSFTTDTPVMCLGEMRTSCVIPTRAKLKTIELTCNAPMDKGEFLFTPQQSYNCSFPLVGSTTKSIAAFSVTP